jgi:predicted permease
MLMREIVRQLSLALRSLSRQPAIMLPAVLTLALGIGSNTALFAYLAAIFRPTLDAPEPERVVFLYSATREAPRRSASHAEFMAIARNQAAVVDLIASARFGASVSDGEHSSFAWAALTSGGYFPFFAARPALGRLLGLADDQPGAPAVAVLSHRFWRGSLGGDPAIVGRNLQVNGVSVQVVGVAEDGFQGARFASAFYVPEIHADRLTAIPRREDPAARWLNLNGRLAPGVTEAKAQAALEVLGRSLDRSAPLADGKPRLMTVMPFSRYDPGFGQDEFVDRARMLMVVASAFLLLGCSSIANLLLARAISKQREWGIRASLGAGRGRLVGGVLAESVVLCLAGGLAGLGVAVLLAGRIEDYLSTSPAGLGDWDQGTRLIELDYRVAAFAGLASVVCALLGALGPVLRILRGDLLVPLKTDAAGTTSGQGLAPRKALLVVQVALSILLLLTGGLLVRTFNRAQNVDPGFQPDGLVLATINIPRKILDDAGGGSLYATLLERARSIPSVSSASLTQKLPVAGIGKDVQAVSLDRPDLKVDVAFNTVAPDYFRTVGVPILAGRALDERDGANAPRAVVVNQEMARLLWGRQAAVGRVLRLTDVSAAEVGERPFEVVGVARDTRAVSLLQPPGPMVFFSFEQRRHSRMTLALRSPASLAALAPGLRRSLRQAHPDLTIVSLVTCREHLADGLFEQRMYAEIAGLFALLGLAVAVVGLFGLMSYSVTLRGREFGIRMAIGARPGDVQRLVVRQGMTLVGIGTAVGMLGALVLGRVLASFLYGVKASDPLTLMAVPAILAAVSLLACWLPARRAARLNPAVTLKSA